MVSFPNLCALGDGCTMKENALKCKAIDSKVKQMHMMLGTERKNTFKAFFFKKKKKCIHKGEWHVKKGAMRHAYI